MTSALPSDEFLLSSNRAYDECAFGIRRLDQMIVSVSSPLAGDARTALTPILYAYWERFFRVVVGDFFRIVSGLRLNVLELNVSLATEWMKFRCTEFHAAYGIKHLAELAPRYGIQTAVQLIEALGRDFLHPPVFEPTKWVDTENNVSFHVVARNLNRIGADIAAFTRHFPKTGQSIFQMLKDLVDSRNRIAHGEELGVTSADEWNSLRETALFAMNALQMTLLDHLESEAVGAA